MIEYNHTSRWTPVGVNAFDGAGNQVGASGVPFNSLPETLQENMAGVFRGLYSGYPQGYFTPEGRCVCGELIVLRRTEENDRCYLYIISKQDGSIVMNGPYKHDRYDYPNVHHHPHGMFPVDDALGQFQLPPGWKPIGKDDLAFLDFPL